MHPRNILAMGRGDHPRQRHGLRTVMLAFIALGAIAGALIVLGCPGDNEHHLSANLTGSQEVPSVTSAATGTVSLTVNSDRTRIDYKVVTVGPFTSNVRFAHIHVQQPGVNGPIVVFYCTNDSPPTGVPKPQPCPGGTAGGTITGTLTAADFIPSAAASALGVNTFADFVTALLNNGTYSNVHTVNNPGGEIRGQNIHSD